MAESELQRMFNHYVALPHGAERIRAKQEALKRSDELDDLGWRLANRRNLALEEFFHGDKAKALPVIAEYIEIFERNLANGRMVPTENRVEGYLRMLDMALEVFETLPQLPMEQWRKMEEKYWSAMQRYHYGKADYFQKKFNQLLCEGSVQEAEEFYRMWEEEQQTNHDQVVDCEGCIQYFRVRHALVQNDWDGAVKEAQPLLGDDPGCSQQPWRVLHLFMTESRDRGSRSSVKEYGKKLRMRLDWDENADAMELLAYDALFDLPHGLKAIESSLERVLGKWDCLQRWRNFLETSLLLQQAACEHETLSLMLPQQLGCYREDGQYDPAELSQWFYEEALKIAQKFDERNGFPYYQNAMEKARAGMKQMTDAMEKAKHSNQ